MVRITKITDFFDSSDNAVKQLVSVACLSTDTKPTAGIATGSDLTEVDTGTVYFFNEASENWVEQFSFQS